MNLCFMKTWPYWHQFIAAFTASLALISCGMEYGWLSPALPIIFSANTPLKTIPPQSEKDFASNLLSSLYLGGGICGIPVSFCMITYLGRRWTILIMASMGLLSWILVATAVDMVQLYVVRFVSGIAANAMYVTVPMYSAECSQPQIRGLFGSFVYIMSMTGVLISYLLVPFIPIWASSLFPICLNFVMLTAFYFQPESPYYLLKRSRTEEARKSLQYFRADKDISSELADISAAVVRQEAEKGRPIDLLLVASNRKATLIMLLLNTAQNMAGVSVIVMNTQYLLQEAATLGGVQSLIPDEWAAVIFSAVMLMAGILGATLVDKCGRRFLLISSGILSAIFLALLSIYYAQTHLFVDANLTWIPIFGLIGYAFAFKCGLGLVPIIISGELFPSNLKALGMEVSDLYFTVLGTFSIQVYHLVQPFGLYMPFAIFSFFAGMTAFLVWIYVPETKGKTLEEIQMILKNKKSVRKASLPTKSVEHC